MNRIRHTAIRWLGLPLAALLLALGPALPLLDVQEGVEGAVLEQEHSQGTCVVGHDHRICLLAGTLRSLLSRPKPLSAPRLQASAHASARLLTPPRGPATSLVRSRAPPRSI